MVEETWFQAFVWQQMHNHYIVEAINKIRDNMSQAEGPVAAKDVGVSSLLERHSSQEEGADDHADVGRIPTRPRCRRTPQWLTSGLQEAVVIIVVAKGHALRIEFIGEPIVAFCSHVAAVRRRAESVAFPDWSAMLHGTDANRVEWNRIKRYFFVSRLDDQGRKVRKQFAAKNSDGEAGANVVLQLARRYWNQVDSIESEPYVGSRLPSMPGDQIAS